MDFFDRLVDASEVPFGLAYLKLGSSNIPVTLVWLLGELTGVEDRASSISDLVCFSKARPSSHTQGSQHEPVKFFSEFSEIFFPGRGKDLCLFIFPSRKTLIFCSFLACAPIKIVRNYFTLFSEGAHLVSPLMGDHRRFPQFL